jgi:hypothetical protein
MVLLLVRHGLSEAVLIQRNIGLPARWLSHTPS